MPVQSAPRASVPRLVATDLDGTLLRTDGTVSPFTISVLEELDRRDIPVVFVTGRPLRWAREVFEHVGSHGLAVVSNGAMVWDVAGDRPVSQYSIPPAVALATAQTLRAEMPDVMFSTETLEGWSTESGHRRNVRFRPLREAPLEEILDQPVLKLLASREGADPDEFVARALELLGESVEVTHSSFPLLEISASGVTKASTLARICAERGIDAADVVAFGDMPNDLPMLNWVGTSYAMRNGHFTVLTQAMHHAPTHEEDGVATVLAELLDL